MRARAWTLLLAVAMTACIGRWRWPIERVAPASSLASLSGTVSSTQEAEGKGGNAVVYLEPIGADAAPQSSADAEIQIRRGRFEPALIVIERGQRVSWRNFDSIYHGVFSYSIDNRFDLGTYAPAESRSVVLSVAGAVRVHCPLHVDEGGVVFVSPSPYYSRASARGRYSIREVPAGRYWLKAWRDGRQSDAREITLRPGESAHADALLRPEGP